MPELVPLEWLAEHSGSSGVLVLDPRTRERYLSGHAAGAVHAWIRGAFDGEGRLLPDGELGEWLGARGVTGDRPVAVYDDYDGQKGAMLAWILEYLGHGDVTLIDAPFGRWQAEGRELFYRPVTPAPATFTIDPKPGLRARRDEIPGAAGPVIDVRRDEEYDGTAEGEEPAGHIPGAVHIDWRSFVEDGERMYATPEEVHRLVPGGGEPIVYCRSGPRAAVAVVALRRAGLEARLYDGSFLDWTRAGMPLEPTPAPSA